MSKFKLVEAKYIDMHHFQMVEGKFLDLAQKWHHNRDVFVYANISNFDSEIENSNVRYYAHSFENLYRAEDYQLFGLKNYDSEVKAELMKTDIYKEKFDIKRQITTMLDEKVNEIYLHYQEKLNIKIGDIYPPDAIKQDGLIETLAELIYEVLRYEKED